MLFEILVHIPSILMAEIAWWVCFGSALTSLVMLFAVAIGIMYSAGNELSVNLHARTSHGSHRWCKHNG
jgi:hypothetical protein